jgi:hypothetical protein
MKTARLLISHIGRAGPPRARRVRAGGVAVALGALLAACASGAGGGGFAGAAGAPTGSAAPADTPCDPTREIEGCFGADRMLCDNGTQSWQLFDSCAAPKVCAEAAMPTLDGALTTFCDDPPSPQADAVGGGDAPVGGGGGGGGGEGPISAEAVCARWQADRAELGEGSWSGSMAACDPGDVDEAARDRALKLVNLYRWLSGLPAVTRDAQRDADAQQCALMMAANGKLSHTPPQSWKCWSQAGADAAKKSNISTAPGVVSVDRYMIDEGAHNKATLGHRRWILARSTGPIGVGSTASKASCLHVIGGSGKAKAAWTAWPPAGWVPLKAFGPVGKTTIDQTGWSVQSDSILVHKATVEVRDDTGAALEVEQWTLGANYGSKYAVAFRPVGWKAEAGRSYRVELTGIATGFGYDVHVLACD